jgi:hypothetical protein
MKNTTLFCFFTLFMAVVNGQTADSSRILRVYIDRFSPPENIYDLQMEFPFLDYTTQPTEGEVHVLIITDYISYKQERVGLCFFGKERFLGQNDTIWYIIPPLTPDLQKRTLVNDAFRRGIYPYLEQCGYQGDLEDLVGERPILEEDLSWNKTQFSVDLNGSFENFSSKHSYTISGNSRFEKNITSRLNLINNLSITHINKKWLYRSRFNGNSNTTQTKELITGIPSPIDTTKLINRLKSWNQSFEISRFLSNHLAIFTKGYYSKYYQKTPLSEYKNKNKYLQLGLFYNFKPFSKFYQNRFIVGVNLRFTPKSDDVIIRSPVKTPWKHNLSVEYFKRNRWGYLDINLSGGYRFDFETYNAYELSLFSNFGFHLGHNVFLTLFNYATFRNDISTSQFGYSNYLYTNKGKFLRFNSSGGLNILLGSGSVNRRRPTLEFADDSDFSNQNNNNSIGWNKWAFIMSGIGYYEAVKHQDQLPNIGKLYNIEQKLRLKPRLTIGRVGKKFRNLTQLGADYEANYQKVYDKERIKIPDQLVFSATQNAVFTFSEHFAIGSSVSIYDIKQKLTSKGTHKWDYNGQLLAGLEYNFNSYQSFLRKSTTIGFYRDLSKFIKKDNNSSGFTHLYCSIYRLKPWGYWSNNFLFQPVIVKKPFESIRFSNGFTFAKKISKSLYFTVRPSIGYDYAKTNFSSKNEISKRFSKSLSYGIEYYLGKGRTNTFNPSIFGLF